MSDELKHYGMPRRSGRYPWGSGKDPYQSAIGFMGVVNELRAQGLSEVEIARGLGITTSQLRARKSLAGAEIRAANVAEALRLKERGLSNVAIGQRMGINESSVRALLNPALAERAAITAATSNMLKDSVSKYGYVDVGTGVENHVGVSRTKMNTAIAELVEQGYKIHYVKVEQMGIPGQYTSVKVLAGPESTYSEVFRNKDLIQPITGRTEDLGRTYSDLGLRPVQSVDSKDVMVRYKKDGGDLKDGVIELRRGVAELDLEGARYAQVRIGVDGTHYMKGMAIYSDDMPNGVNVIYNTNKSSTGNKLDAMKPMKPDPDNPFGSTLKQIIDPDSGQVVFAQKGALNVIREEGDWDTWSRTISSQVLSKQTPALAKRQLDLAYQLKREEFDEIMTLTNPTVKRQLLNSFADDADSSSVHLKAAMLPRQSNKVILPIPSLKEREVYAPSYNDGENVVLIRHPHGGTFEIPQLVVNNKSPDARNAMGNAQDAIGINPVVVQKLSGADFDGDTVIVIPNNGGMIRTQASLRGLENFDHIEMYRIPEGSGIPKIKPQTMQTKMGEVSNLITDMTIQGATTDELARAVRHSMVVIDSEKHNLNYRQSHIDNGISSLAGKYQGSARGGASTLISRASSEVRVPERKESHKADPETGERVFTPTGATYIQRSISPSMKREHGIPANASYTQSVAELRRQGVGEEAIARGTNEKLIERTTRSTRMAETQDARTLLSGPNREGTPVERAYADYANQMKALANTARKEALATESIPYSPSARTAYAQEVATLTAQLNVARKNAPRERQAQIIANTIVAKKAQANPPMDRDDLKKMRTQALAEARVRAGARRDLIEITPREWEAIQAGAVTNSMLQDILNNTDLDVVKQYATPRNSGPVMTPARIARAESMLASGYTQAEVAQALGVSVPALVNAVYK